MKKIISLIFALMLICMFCTSAFAAGAIALYGRDNKAIPQGTYSALYIDDSAKGTIENGKTVTMENATLTIKGTLDIEGKLEGTVESVIYSNSHIILGENGYFQLTFTGTNKYLVPNFVSQLSNNGILYEESEDESGNTVITSHKHKFATICTGCDYYEEPVTATSSVLSHGYPEIIYGIGGLAVGFIAAMLIFRRKKAAVSGVSAEDEE